MGGALLEAKVMETAHHFGFQKWHGVSAVQCFVEGDRRQISLSDFCAPSISSSSTSAQKG
jgi:hypothetical protein